MEKLQTSCFLGDNQSDGWWETGQGEAQGEGKGEHGLTTFSWRPPSHLPTCPPGVYIMNCCATLAFGSLTESAGCHLLLHPHRLPLPLTFPFVRVSHDITTPPLLEANTTSGEEASPKLTSVMLPGCFGVSLVTGTQVSASTIARSGADVATASLAPS